MSKPKRSQILLLVALFMSAMPSWSRAEDQWHFQAAVEANGPGYVEAVLPEGLFFSADSAAQASQLDLSLIGPDGNLRSFEIYWKEDNSPQSMVIKSPRIHLDKSKALIWEGEGPKDVQIDKIRIDFSQVQAMGTVMVEGKDAEGWHLLVDNAALYRSENMVITELDIKPAVYEELRLSFKGYDKEFKQTPFQVISVTVSGKSNAKDYTEKTLELAFSEARQGEKIVATSLLPGSGLWIKGIELSTEAQFQGSWEIGHEVAQNGKTRFERFLSGAVSTVGNAGLNVDVSVNSAFSGRSLTMSLDPGDRYVGRITSMKITVRLPRLVFYADKPGTYMAQVGNGNYALIKDTPGNTERKVDNFVSFSSVTENRQWVPERLLEKYAVIGGPFDEKGYRWASSMMIPESGFYRLVLNREASLSPNLDKVRLVGEMIQVPYFRGPSEEKEIFLEAANSYDQKKNTSSWVVTLPKHAASLGEMTLESQGIFDRQVVLEIPKGGRTIWQPWKVLRWQSEANGKATLRVGMSDLQNDVTEIRITISHGDNRPIDINKIQTTYYAPTLLFLINKPGEYKLFGGNPEALEARYDLALVQAHLINIMPKSVVMGELELFQTGGVKDKIWEAFDEKSWGLYVVLGLVTLILMILIVRIFPHT